MTGNAKDVGTGAVKGAALGAPLGPYGAAVGGVAGGVYGYFSGGPSDADKAAAEANDARQRQSHQSAIALENYRQSARNQYHNLLTAETTPYQGASNWLAALTGSGMSTAGLAANENPLTLQDTGVGAPLGSNYASSDQIMDHDLGNGQHDRRGFHTMGIGEQIGDDSANAGGSVAPGQTIRRANGDAVTGNAAPVNADVAAYMNPANNSTYQPSQMATASPTSSNRFAGAQFMPRRP